jgi:hypothetical protein
MRRARSMPIESLLTDDVVDAYVDWREQSQRVWLAYQAWSRTASGEARLRFAAYVAELDREHRASDAYAAAIARAAVGGRAAAGRLPPVPDGLSRSR